MSLDPSERLPSNDAGTFASSGGEDQAGGAVSNPAHDKALDELDPETVAAAQRMLRGLDVAGGLGPERKQPPSVDPGLEELADDMLQLLRRVSAVEQRLDGLIAGVDRLGYQVHEGAAVTARQLDMLRRDLLGDRRALATGSVFEVAVSALDTLAAMQGGIDPEQDRRMLDQLAAVTSALTSLIQRLGFVAFEAVPGEPFDPIRMRCLGFGKGMPGVVLTAVSAGYAAGGTIVRPAGVLIADPMSPDRPDEETAP